MLTNTDSYHKRCRKGWNTWFELVGFIVTVNAKMVVCHVVKDFDKIWLGFNPYEFFVMIFQSILI